jgi:hypothetical protein
MLARMRTGIETAQPTPLRLAGRDADPPGDRANMDVAVIDVPAIVAFWVAAAGESGHARTIPPIGAKGKPLGFVAWAAYVSQDRGLSDEALAAGVAAPKVNDLPAGVQRRSFRRDHQVRADRTARHIPRSGPRKGRLFSIRRLKRNHDAPVRMRPQSQTFRKVRFFTSLSFSAQALFQVIHN